MPVRIKAEPLDPAEFAISSDKLESGIENFKIHYHLLDGSPDFVSDFSTSWNDLYNAVQNYKGQFPEVPEAEIAMRFIHCYDPGTTSLYLRLQICQMQLTTITEYDSDVWQLLNNHNQLWYQLKQGSITEVPASTMYDEVYLDSFEYTLVAEGDSTEQLSEDGGFKFVRTLTFPWQSEIYQMYVDNGSPSDPPDTVNIHYCACSYTEGEPGSSSVLWPHGLVMYLEVNGEPMLDNENYISIFHYKGADLATMCPPKCGSYVTPPTLS